MMSSAADSKAFSRGYLPAVRWLTLGLMYLGNGGPAFLDESQGNYVKMEIRWWFVAHSPAILQI